MPDKSNKPHLGTHDSLPEYIAHYRILQRLGKGGMGEVFLGEDTKQHNRKVALKVLPSGLLKDEGRLRRFRQEARAILALNHPNILTIYEIGESSESNYIATEFIEGETLRHHLWRQRLTVDEALGIGIQVAMALEAAHAEGIVHRDIKPENIMLREDRFVRDRFVKVLDFGLAKLTERNAPASDPEAVTIPISETSPGAVIGTNGYMSPEQAAGETIDARSDIFSLGVVLYELVAGEQPFKGRTDSHTRVSILDHEPTPLLQHSAEIPRQLERIVSKALAKDRGKRYQTITDLKLDLEQLRDELQVSETTVSERPSPPQLAETIRISSPPTQKRSQVETLADPSPHHSSIHENKTSPLKTVAIYSSLAVLAVSLFVGLYWWRFSPAPISSVAILPFANQSNDPNAEYLSDGLTESITNSLSQLRGLKVMSRNAAFRFKNMNQDPQEAGRSLNVGAVLTGRLVRFGDQVVIKTELIKVADGSQLWGAEYKSALADILSVQDEVSHKISENLRVRLTGDDEQKLAKRYSNDGEAYQLYLKGRYFWNKRNEEGFRNSIDYFKRAEERDPTFGLAFSGLADSYALLCDIGVVAPVDEMPKAKAAAQKAVDADPSLAEAFTSRAFVKLSYDWNWLGAEDDFQQALKLNPKYPTAHQWYASYLMQMGKFTRAKTELEEAHNLDPLSPIISSNTGLYSYYEHNYDDAIAKYKLTLQTDPDFWVAQHYLGLAYVQKGMINEAIAQLRALIKAPPSGPLPDQVVANETEACSSLGFVYGMAGKRAEALAILDQLQALSQRRYVSGFYFAVVYAGLKDTDKAIEYLNRAFDNRHPGLVLIRIEPMFDGLRSDERFKQLVKRFEPMP
ncbi:MAG TPA: protein kinase [Pyrinomonadaceae bacterium]|jgi:serine/threonine-protein kinase|nr:protein kinase [Pyrinomonadaceae bacterium]